MTAEPPPVLGRRAPNRALPRYLGAFGPGSVQDVQHWSGLRQHAEATLRIDPFAPVPKAERAAPEEEGMRLLAAAHPEAKAHAVAFTDA